jgi:hypothetical protein
LTIAAWQLREDLRADLGKRQRACGRMRYVKQPMVRGGEHGAYWDGVLRCRSRECAVCFLARRMKLLAEVRYVAEARSRETHRRLLLATLTVRHSAADGVAITKQVRKCWRKFISGREWMDFKRKFAPEWICAEEITHGANGWHPHIHVALLPASTSEDLLSTASWWYERWAAIVEKTMGPQHWPDPNIGTDLRYTDSADYVSKIAWELSDAGCVKGSTPTALIEAGRKDLYIELQSYRKYARDVTWSTGLRTHRDAFADEPKPDAELFAVLRGTEYEWLAQRGWQALYDLTTARSAEDVAGKLRYHNTRAEALGADECAAHIASLNSSLADASNRAGGGSGRPSESKDPPKTIWEREHGM